ncbi:CLUMA_CG012791, isoform A [Clunio marinus]|uniref:CLUMA_CG012791, isoform A n=1 Tax=Clunio marinus TaxID=568069 RepID=A0A1J1IGC3_9DIPT|nr:CLUMA_CG012791, isoform A [Clunio marinus]
METEEREILLFLFLVSLLIRQLEECSRAVTSSQKGWDCGRKGEMEKSAEQYMKVLNETWFLMCQIIKITIAL